jgi:drug/metabolite transporter (DMT)-like permease
MSMVVPVMTTALGIFVLREGFNLFQGIGGALIILSGLFIHKLRI